MGEPTIVYVFRSHSFSGGGGTLVSAAALDRVVAAFGGGGLKGEGGLATIFGGVAFFKSDAAEDCYLGVWGSRRASRFRRMLRDHGLTITIAYQPPPGRLVWSQHSSVGS